MHVPESTAPSQTSAPLDALFDAVYERLKKLASHQLARGARATLDTTALVHELYLRVCERNELAFEHPGQFFAYASRAMRHLLTDRARAHLCQKAGGEWVRTTLTAGIDARASLASAEQAIALDEALTRLEQTDARAARVVELRYFAGLSPEQIADLIGLTRRTIDRDWRFARAFLHTALE